MFSMIFAAAAAATIQPPFDVDKFMASPASQHRFIRDTMAKDKPTAAELLAVVLLADRLAK